MSPGRWRSAGTRNLKVLMRKYKSSRNSRATMAWRKSLLVAAITRTSTATECSEPRRVTWRSCSTRSNLDCKCMGISPISSKKIVPPLACSNRPRASLWAPVNAPFSWPNSMSSMSCSGKAAQLRPTNGPRARLEDSCNTRAKISLPAPVGPSISAVTLACATR